MRRRAPGAQLPDTGAAAAPAQPTPALDPDAARALVEEFEAGVARALEAADDLRSGTIPTDREAR